MKVKAATAVLSLAVMVSAAAPVLADDAPSATPEEKTETKSDGGRLSGLPGKALGATFGVLFGTPIAIVRKSAVETVSATRDLVGETDNPFLLGAAGILGVPAGICSGVLQGPFVAAKNGWDNKPFSKESFSLGGK